LALGQRLRAARLRRGMSQAILAERVGVTIQTLSKLEAGNPTTSVATNWPPMMSKAGHCRTAS